LGILNGVYSGELTTKYCAIRFDIFKGAFTRDSTYIVSPFTSDLQFIKDVPYGLAKQILPILNRGEPQVLELTQLANPTKKWKFDLSVFPPTVCSESIRVAAQATR